MPSFSITVDGQATLQVPPDRASIRVEVSAKGKTDEAARTNLAAKAAGFEAIVLSTVLDKRTGGTSDTDGTDFVMLTDDSDRELADDMEPLELLKGGKQASKSSTRTPTPTKAQISAQKLIESWTKSSISVSNYKPNVRKTKKAKRADNSIYPAYTGFIPAQPCNDIFDPLYPMVPPPEHTVKMTYTIIFSDADAIARLDLDKLDCRTFRQTLRLLPETRAAAKAALRQMAAANALTQATDYCKGLLCNAATTRISPVEFGTVASVRREARQRDRSSTRRGRYDSPARSYSTDSSDSEDFSDFEERMNKGAQRNMIELEHRVEVTFKIDTDELILSNI